MARMTATEVSRNFSAVLSRVADGEEVEITRNGAPIAVLRPAKRQFLTGKQWRELLESAPPVDPDFARDLEEIRRSVGPPEPRWPS
jgi:prevent-host-death family protein